MIRNPHTLEDSWWDGPERFQYVNRNVISQVQHEDLYKYIKLFAPNKIGIDIGGERSSDNGRSSWQLEKEPFSLKLNIKENAADIYARAEKLPFKNETVGYIVSFHTVEHIRGDLLLTFQEWLRVLVPNGLIGIVMPNKKYFLHNAEEKEDGIYAYHEMEPLELYSIFKKIDNIDIILFNSRENNFDFDIIIKKRKT